MHVYTTLCIVLHTFLKHITWIIRFSLCCIVECEPAGALRVPSGPPHAYRYAPSHRHQKCIRKMLTSHHKNLTFCLVSTPPLLGRVWPRRVRSRHVRSRQVTSLIFPWWGIVRLCNWHAFAPTNETLPYIDILTDWLTDWLVARLVDCDFQLNI